jgi:hypothetical protein
MLKVRKNARTAALAVAAVAVLVTGLLIWPLAASASNATPTVTAVKSAVGYGHGRGERVAVAVYDRYTKQSWSGGDVNSYYASASVVKTFIAARLLATGQIHGTTAQLAARMIELSDDDAATALYGRVGGDSLYLWVRAKFHIPVAPPPDPGFWGETRITAAGMISFYNQVATLKGVGGWLMTAMGHYSCTAADGWPQCFGIPSVAASRPRIKQGWMCCLEGRTRMHSTGYVDSDRILVAILTESSTSTYGAYARDTVTNMAKRLMPGGHVPLPYSFGAAVLKDPPLVGEGTLVSAPAPAPAPPAAPTGAPASGGAAPATGASSPGGAPTVSASAGSSSVANAPPPTAAANPGTSPP